MKQDETLVREKLARAEQTLNKSVDVGEKYVPTLGEVINHPQFVQEVCNIVMNIDKMHSTLRRGGIKPNRSPFDTLADKGIVLTIREPDVITTLATEIYTKTCKDLSSTERRWLKRLFDVAGSRVAALIVKEKSNQ
ncbi:MAG: hypothetical protein IIU75_04835 [Rikenellaceae bacterium]|nr:hypothetical protein [Alistipes sp.]MBQ5596384.1 hypothetical protein [Rikenellaceae bacterium]